ncbi:MAG: hypothetical protein NT075_37700 [Chloroflexi bacterium]|nr:hypothetical protein [Chloroflexota bacterium]
MQPLLNIGLWVFFWPVKLPLWLWQQETIGKVFATLWIACVMVIGLNLLPRQTKEMARPPATSEPGASLQSLLLTRLRRATPLAAQNDEQAETLLTSTQASPGIDLALVTSTPAITIDSSVVATTPLLLPTSTLLSTLTATATQSALPTDTEQPSKQPTMIPTVTPFYTPTPDSASQLVVATPTMLDPAPTSIASESRPTTTSSVAPAINPSGFTCAGGCSEAPDPSCAIKGNVNAKGDKIYHLPGGKNYDLTRIKPAEGDRWFCTEQEAQDAGFRAAKSY